MTQNAQHTPGPWVICEEPTGDTIRQDDESALLICEFPYGAIGDSADAANARLIAAAPELYEALAAMVSNYLDTYGDEGDDAPLSVKRARAALAKASGSESARSEAVQP